MEKHLERQRQESEVNPAILNPQVITQSHERSIKAANAETLADHEVPGRNRALNSIQVLRRNLAGRSNPARRNLQRRNIPVIHQADTHQAIALDGPPAELNHQSILNRDIALDPQRGLPISISTI